MAVTGLLGDAADPVESDSPDSQFCPVYRAVQMLRCCYHHLDLHPLAKGKDQLYRAAGIHVSDSPSIRCAALLQDLLHQLHVGGVSVYRRQGRDQRLYRRSHRSGVRPVLDGAAFPGAHRSSGLSAQARSPVAAAFPGKGTDCRRRHRRGRFLLCPSAGLSESQRSGPLYRPLRIQYRHFLLWLGNSHPAGPAVPCVWRKPSRLSVWRAGGSAPRAACGTHAARSRDG